MVAVDKACPGGGEASDCISCVSDLYFGTGVRDI